MTDRLFRGRIGLAVLSGLGVLVLLQVITAGSQEPDGRSAPAGSSYSTNGDGHKAYRQLLDVSGYDVGVARVGFADAPPAPSSTIIVIGGNTLPVRDQTALREFVSDGGRLVVSGQPLMQVLGTELATMRGDSATLTPPLPHPAVVAVGEVAAPERTVYTEPGPLLGILGPIETPAAGVVRVGTGSVWAVADSSILSNEVLDEADNAVFGLALAGDGERPVVFAEYNHGYEPITGLASLPGRWRVALWMAALSGVVWMVSRGRRLGPPARSSRQLPPPRSAYVTAMAESLLRTKELDAATVPVRERIRRELVRRGGDDAANIARIATQVHLDPATINRALLSPTGPDDVVAAGVVLARVSRNRL